MKNGDTDTISDALKMFGDQDSAAKWFGHLNTKSDGSSVISDGIIDIFQGAFKNIDADAVKKNIAKGAKAESSSLGDILSDGIGNLVGGVTSFGSGISAVLGSVAQFAIPLILGGLAIHAGKSLWNNVLTNNNANKKYEESSQKYDNAVSERDSLQSEYNTNKERYYELNAKENRSTDEQAELENLASKNSLMESQLKVKDNLVDATQKQQALDAKDALEKSGLRTDKTSAHWYENGLLRGKTGVKYQDDIDEANDMIEKLNRQKAEREELISNESNYSPEKFKKKLASIEDDISTTEGQLTDSVADISDKAQDLWDDNGNLIDESARNTAKRVQQLTDNYKKAVGSTSTTSDKMNNIFALSQFSDLKDKLIAAGKSGGTDAIQKMIDDTDGLKDAMSNAGLTADDLKDSIMSIADPDAKNLEGIKENLEDIFGKDGLGQSDFFKGKTDKELENFWDYLQDNNYNPKQMNWNEETTKKNFEAAQEAKKKTPEESVTFASKFKNSIEDTATDIDTVTDNFQSDMKNIQSAMESVTNGTFQNSDMADLIQQFPELSNASGDLKDNLQDLAMNKGAEAIGKIRDSVKDVTDPKQLAQADKYVQSIMDTMDMSDFDFSEKAVRARAFGALTKNSKNAIDIKNKGNLVDSLMEKYSGNETAMQAIVQLSMDPSMADATMEEWEAKIEDQEVQIKINTDTKELDNLSKEMTRLQTDASNTQTDMSNKAAFNQKVNENDYDALIKNGDAQIKNYDEQIAHYKNLQKTLKENNIDAESTEQWKQWQDNIDAAQQSIENMKASQAEWGDAIKNLPITDITNLSSAITTAMSEMQSDTGLTTDSVKNLATQFSDLGDINIDSLYTRTAKGLQLNTDRLQDYMEQQNDFVNSDFENKVKDQKKIVEDTFKAYQNGDKSLADYAAEQDALDELLNRRNQYFARYQEAQERFTDFQKMQNAKNAANAGDEYTTAKSDLENLKDLYDKNLVGTKEFKKGAAYFSQNGFEDPENFIENYNHLKKYYTDDSSGPQKFLEDLNKKGLATYETLANGQKQWAYSFNDVKDAADQMGMSYESFQSILGRLSDYGFVNNLVTSTQDGEQQIDELTDDLITEKNKLSKLKANGATDQAIQDQENVVDQLESKISGVNQAVTDYANGETDRKVQDLKEAKQIIKDSKEAYDEAMKSGDTDLAQKLLKNIQDTADSNHIELTTDFDIDENELDKQIESLENEKIRKYQEQKGSVDLTNRPVIKSEELIAAGYDNVEPGESATVFSSGFSTEDGKKTVVVTPILPDGSVLNPDDLEKYANQILETGTDSKGIGIRTFEGDDSIAQADAYAEMLHNVQDAYYCEDEAARQSLDTLKDYSAQELLGINYGDGKYDEQYADAEKAVDGLVSNFKEMGMSEMDAQTAAEALIKSMDDMDLLKATPKVDDSEIKGAKDTVEETEESVGNLQNLSGSTLEVQCDVSNEDSLEQAKSAIESMPPNTTATVDVEVDGKDDVQNVIDLMQSAPTDGSEFVLNCDVQNADDLKAIQAAANELNKTQGTNIQVQATVTGDKDADKLKTSVDSLKGKTVNVTAKVKGTPQVKALHTAIESVNSKTVNVSANVTGTSAVGSLARTIDSLHDKTVTVSVKQVGSVNVGKGNQASGTMLSPAHASGTAYNVLNMKQLSPAHAGGNVALKHNEQALVNEVGTESIVRNGVWSLLPGGAHLENLKQGDIVFSASQTKDLLEHGRTAGHARAYAEGTASLAHAYARSSAANGGGAFGGVRTRTTSPSTSSNNNSNNAQNNNAIQAIADNTDSIAKSSGETAENTSKWEDPWKNAVDWFERYSTKIDNKLDLNSAISENYQGNKNSKNPFSIETKNRKLSDSISTIQQEVPNYQKQRDYYAWQAEAYGDKIGLSQDLRKLVQEGKIQDIEIYDEDTKSKIEAYQTWYDKVHSVESSIEDLKSKEADLWNQKFSNITDRYDALKSIYSNNNDVISAQMDYREASGQSQTSRSAYANDIKLQRANQIKQNSLTAVEIKKYRTELRNLGIEYGTQSTIYKQAQANLIDLNKEYQEGKKSVQEFTNKLNEIKLTDLQNVIDKYDRASSKQSSYRDWKDATHYKGTSGVTQNDIKEGIKTNEKSINALYAKRAEVQRQMLNLSPGSEDYQSKAKEFAQLSQDILNTAKNTAELRQELAKLRTDQYDKAIKKLDHIVTDCENIQGMMDSDTFLSDDGSFTTNGLTNIALENQSIQANQRKIADWKQELAELQKAYNNHYITEEDFISQSESIVSNINQAAKDINSSQQNLISTYIDQITKENEYLQDNISKRKEALDAKKDYYDFDKTIKSKTKDINAIKAQIAALEGTTNAVAKAKLEQLKADLADKQDDLNDTKYDHKIDMESKGYDNLADQADKALDSATQAIKTNTDMQKSVISNMLKEVQKNYKDVYSNITDIVKDSGAQISTEFNKLLTNIKNGKGNFTVTITSKAKANIGGTNAFDNKAPGSTGRENGKTNTEIKNTAKDMGTSNGASDENGVGKQLLQKVTASPSSITMGVGRGAFVKIGFVPSNATYKTFTYEESNKGIVSIVKGKTSLSLKGLKVGSTTITVKGHGAGCKSAKITVKVTKDGAQKTATAKNVAKSMGYSLHTNDVTKILNATKGESNSSTKDFVKSYILQKKWNAAEQEIKKSDLKTKLSKWFTALPAFKGDASKIADPVIKHIAQKGKKATIANIQTAASILGYKDYKNISKWSSAQKNALVKKLQSYGFANGGIIRELIPASMGTLLGDAIMRNGDTGLISARQGETVLTEEFTNMLKPTVAAMNAFTDMYQKMSTPNINSTATKQQTIFNPEYNINITGMDLSKANELKSVIRGELDNHDKQLAKEFKKFR